MIRIRRILTIGVRCIALMLLWNGSVVGSTTTSGNIEANHQQRWSAHLEKRRNSMEAPDWVKKGGKSKNEEILNKSLENDLGQLVTGEVTMPSPNASVAYTPANYNAYGVENALKVIGEKPYLLFGNTSTLKTEISRVVGNYFATHKNGFTNQTPNIETIKEDTWTYVIGPGVIGFLLEDSGLSQAIDALWEAMWALRADALTNFVKTYNEIDLSELEAAVRNSKARPSTSQGDDYKINAVSEVVARADSLVAGKDLSLWDKLTLLKSILVIAQMEISSLSSWKN